MILKFGKEYVIECDVCGTETEEGFESFGEAVEFKRTKSNGWISRKVDDNWEDLCSDCKEDFNKGE